MAWRRICDNQCWPMHQRICGTRGRWETYNVIPMCQLELDVCFVLTLIARLMGPIYGPSWADRTQVDPMNFVIWASVGKIGRFLCWIYFTKCLCSITLMNRMAKVAEILPRLSCIVNIVVDDLATQRDWPLSVGCSRQFWRSRQIWRSSPN